MGRPSSGGHIRVFPRHKTSYRLISVEIDGVRRQRFEHRLIMEQIIGRPLEKYEIVHHKDGNGLNNDPSNLQLLTQSEHIATHKVDCAKRRKWSREEAKILRDSGLTLKAIGKIFGVTEAAIRMGFIREGINTADIRRNNN